MGTSKDVKSGLALNVLNDRSEEIIASASECILNPEQLSLFDTKEINLKSRITPSKPVQLELASILGQISEVAYHWSFSDDCISWSENAPLVLGVSDLSQISRGSAFSLLVDPAYASTRYDQILKHRRGEDQVQDPEEGVYYRTKYRFYPEGRRGGKVCWLEECGRWFAKDGLPKYAQGVVRVLNSHYEEEERLRYLSRYDEVTGQLNRFHLIQAISSVLDQAAVLKGPSMFLVAAVDNLKLINDSFGYEIGDEVLSIIGRCLRAHMREPDLIGRFGSNKFGILLYDCAEEQAKIAGRRFTNLIDSKTIETSKGVLAASISIGGVMLPQHATTVQMVMSRALDALNQTKHKLNKSNLILYSPSEKRENRHYKNSLIADEIINALNERRFCLALQPIVDARTYEVSFYECLLRLRKEDGSIVSAFEFITVAEQLGLSRLIDHRVLELAMDLIKTYQDIKISLNVSGRTANDESWLLNLQNLTRSDRTLTERVIVEITETAAIEDLEESVHFVNTLKRVGCRVAIDDFGAGYSSFRNLKRLGVDMVKIDGEFVKEMRNNPDDRVFIKALIDLANNFNLDTVAEWVADSETAEMLSGMGIGHFQGFLFGMPKLIEDYADELTATPIPKEARHFESASKKTS